MRHDGTIALITGGGTGIGKATARILVQEGARVLLVGRRSGALERTARELDPDGHQIRARSADLRSTEQVNAAVAEVVDRFGALTVLVNAAGAVPAWAPVAETTDESWTDTLETNLTGVFRTTRAALPHLVRSGGAIVNVGSISGLRAANSVAPYAAAKAGLLALTRSVAAEYGWRGVRCNCVVPSWVDTPMTAAFLSDPDTRAEVGRRHALQRVAEPREVAGVIAFLASSEASFVTGAACPVDGGMSAL